MTEHYLEVHVNVEPLEGYGMERDAAEWAARHMFRRGKLLMDKGRPAPDAFFTWRGTDVAAAEKCTRSFVSTLTNLGIKVLRYKLEMTLVDSRESDRWELLPVKSEETQ